MKNKAIKDQFRKDFDDKYNSFELAEPIYKESHDKLWDFIDKAIDKCYQQGWDDRWEHEKNELIKAIDIKLGPLSPSTLKT